jgi:cytochrome c
MKYLPLAATMVLLSAPAFAEGDAANGETIFNRQCSTCHVVMNDAGETLAGRAAHVGPNLFGVVGRTPGTYPDFEYGDSMLAYGATGAVWGEDNLPVYVQDPTDFLRTALDDRRARGKMAFQLRDPQDAADVFAFLSTFSTPAQ